MKVVLYRPEDSDTAFTCRLISLEEAWRATPSGSRTGVPLCDDRRIRRNENGIGIELGYLPLNLPPMFVDAEPTFVEIEEDYLTDAGGLVAGVYRRGRTTATVTMRTNRPSNGMSPYNVWMIRVSGASLKLVARLYDDIRSGRAKPTSPWIKNDSDSAKQ